VATLPNPKTWVLNDDLDAATLNLEIRDALIFLLKPPRCRAYRNAGLSLTNNTWTVIGLDQETLSFDTDNMHSTVTNNSRITIQTAGAYVIYWQLGFASNATGQRQVDILKNAAGTYDAAKRLNNTNATAIGGSLATTMAGTVEVEFALNDHFEMWGLQNCGAALNIVAGATETFVGCYFQGKI